ncbi:MAG: DinB family protein [Acidobacteriota bacterium]
MTAAERTSLIEKYSEGYEEVRLSLEGFPAGELTAHPIPGKWSAAEIVHHLADSEMTSAMRLRLLLVEDHAVIHGYDQDAFATQLRYNEREIGPSLEALRWARASTSQLLDRMSEEQWQRQGWHTESGPYSTEKWLRIYSEHAHNHASQIRRLREVVVKQ